MFIVGSYTLAVILCFITMLCWGSWANTQKIAAKSWRFELFYWDYVLGILLFSLILGFTFGSSGSQGMGFFENLKQAESASIISALAGGIIFNLANILIVAAISIAGMSVAFPVGIGIALVLGVIINYIGMPQGNPVWLFGGVALVGLAIVIDALAYGKKAAQAKKVPAKGIIISIVGGVLMAMFYRFVAGSMAKSRTAAKRMARSSRRWSSRKRADGSPMARITRAARSARPLTKSETVPSAGS